MTGAWRSEGAGMTVRVAPFPYFGSKRTVAAEVWQRLGTVANYVEPFFGSGAVLLARPDAPGVETISDADHFICNLWRAIAAAPDQVGHFADWPVNEADLQSRHYWLVTEGAARIAGCAGSVTHYDAQVAGWWLWGACAWIGRGWCSGDGPWAWDGAAWVNRKLPHVGDAGQGIKRVLPHMAAGRGINRQVPHVGDAGRGINRQLPHMGNAGQKRASFIQGWLDDLSSRLRHVRIACGDWSRVCGDSVTWRHGLTGVFLDPPYGVVDRAQTYTHDCRAVAADARDWAIESGKRPDMRIALCGYDGEHAFPADWTAWHWKAQGGYGNQGNGQGSINAARETIWFSPACISVAQPDMFASQPPS